MNCQQLIDRLLDDPRKAQQIDLAYPFCACEQESVSSSSPGMVKDDEWLAHQIFTPIHYDEETKRIKEAAFHDCGYQGLSVDRHLHASIAEIRERAEEKAAKDRERRPDRQAIGYIDALAMAIRGIRSQPNQARLCILDTSYPEHRAHADILATHAPTKLERAQLRRELQKQFSNLIPFQRNGDAPTALVHRTE